MTSPQPLPRKYTPNEVAAFQFISPKVWNQPYQHHRGPAWFACGPGQPDDLLQRAHEAEAFAKACRVAAHAMRGEGCV